MTAQQQASPESASGRPGYGVALAVCLAGTGISLAIWSHGTSQERARIRVEFEAAAQNYAASVRRSTELAALLVSSARSWHVISGDRGARAFRAFTTPLLRDLRGVGALEWVPRVRAEERADFEASMRAAGVAGFLIKERDAEGTMVPAGRRAEYFPVSDVEPGSEPSPVVGFDLGSEPVRREALRRAVQSGRVAATGRLSLVQTRGQYGFQLIAPVFGGHAGLPSLAQREARLTGYVVGVFRVADMVEDALATLRPLELDVEILDESAPPGEQVLYSRASRREARGGGARGEAPTFLREARLTVGGRSWAVRSWIRPEFVAARETGNPERLLLAGLLLTALLVGALLVTSAKTRALAGANAGLRAASAERERAIAALRDEEERYRRLTEAAFEGILVAHEGTIVDANPRLAEMLGYGAPVDLLGMKTLELVAPESRGEFAERSRASDDGPYELVGLARDGHSFPVEVRVRSVQVAGRGLRIGAITDITERKQARARLQEQEERFRRLAEAAFEGIAVTYKGTVIDANAQLARMLGYETGDLLGVEAWKLVAPESRSEVAERMRTGSEGPYEHLALARDGRVLPVEVRARMIPVGERQVRISAIRDVTEQKRAQQELASGRAFLDTIFTGLDLAVWVLDVSERGRLKVAACNPAWEKLVGVAAGEVRGRAFEELAGLFPPERVEEERAALLRCVAEGGPIREEASDGLLAGRGGDFLRQLNPLRSAEGRVYRVIGTAIEVTELRRAERTLRAGQRLMAEAERIARLGSWEADLGGGHLRVSEEVWRIIGRPASLSPADAWSWEQFVGFVHPEDRARVQDTFDRLQSGVSFHGLEHRFLGPEGEPVFVVVHGEVEKDAAGRAVRAIGSVQDVTERTRAEEAAERQREELLRADKMIALGTLLSGVAHEINNPNHFIMLNLQLLRSVWKDAAPVLEAHAASDPGFSLANLPYDEMRTEVPALIDEVIGGADRIKFIVSELKGYVREHTGSGEPVSLNDVVRSALTLIASPIKQATRRFSVSYADDLPGVRGNLRRLEQVVINLILNACQALPDPDRAVRVETGHDPEGGRVVVTVADEGTGIAEADLRRIMDPFFTTKRERGGTGLGLAVSARIVEEHGGRLSFDSALGRGTVARISLPVRVEDGS
jgi:PAS domain S-box-containing protein